MSRLRCDSIRRRAASLDAAGVLGQPSDRAITSRVESHSRSLEAGLDRFGAYGGEK